MADTDSERLERWQRGSVQERAGERATGESGSLPDPDSEPARRVTESRQERREWEPEPGVGRVANGIPRRMDRLRALGNSVVPQVVEVIGRAILEAERQ
jgi:DNA (cytosine-5)-methyltransferase 1